MLCNESKTRWMLPDERKLDYEIKGNSAVSLSNIYCLMQNRIRRYNTYMYVYTNKTYSSMRDATLNDILFLSSRVISQTETVKCKAIQLRLNARLFDVIS